MFQIQEDAVARNTKSRARTNRAMRGLVGRINTKHTPATLSEHADKPRTMAAPAVPERQEVIVVATARQPVAKTPVRPLAVRRPMGTSNIYSGAPGLKQFR